MVYKGNTSLNGLPASPCYLFGALTLASLVLGSYPFDAWAVLSQSSSELSVPAYNGE